jgi:hypothetical protein
MSDVYPATPDWDAAVLATLPSLATAGDGKAWILGLTDKLAELDAAAEGLVRELLDIESAGAYVLAAKGARYQLARGGMSIPEDRRIVAGAEAAQACRRRRSWRTLTNAFRVLCGTEDVLCRRIKSRGEPAVFLEGRITFQPSIAWLAAAGRVVSMAVDPAIEWEAAVVSINTAQWDNGTWQWDNGTWSTSPWSYPLLGGP